MIIEKDLKQLFMNGQSVLAKHADLSKPFSTQFFRGRKMPEQHPGGCSRHISVFEDFNVIPKYCFNCYKILVEPRTVIELFKLMVVFKNIELPNDNIRKCTIEGRNQVSGAYKGLIYCRGIEEAREMLKITKKVVSKEVSRKIPITLKRGCSEYATIYPEYAQIKLGATAMEYKEEWQEVENIADKKMDINTQPSVRDSHNNPAYTVEDAGIMLSWLKYAAAIGDLSYKKISGCTLPPLEGLKRPHHE